MIVDTRHSPSGQIIDYVLAETLYPGEPDAPFAKPPYELPAATDIEGPDGRPIRPGVTEIEADPMLWPPPGTIAVLRERFIRYVEAGDDYRDLAEYIATLPGPANEPGAPSSGGHHADLESQELTGMLELWSHASLGGSADPSVMQLSEYCLSGDAVQSMVGSGFAESRDVFGDEHLHLFTFFTRQGYGSDADYGGGWNLQTKGFVQYAGATSFPGATVDSSTMSERGGDRYECVVKLQRGADGNWWVYACNNWLGYYPTQRSTTVVAPARRIHFGQLARGGCGTRAVEALAEPEARPVVFARPMAARVR